MEELIPQYLNINNFKRTKKKVSGPCNLPNRKTVKILSKWNSTSTSQVQQIPPSSALGLNKEVPPEYQLYPHPVHQLSSSPV